MKKRILSLVLVFIMVMSVCPTLSFAAADEATVNGVDLIADEDHTIECGDGTATYDPDTKVVTLTNATITGSSSGGFGIDLDGEVNTIVLVGDNAITAPNGIREDTATELIIKSLDDDTDGSLDIVVTGTDYPYAICSRKSVTIEGVTINMKHIDEDNLYGCAIETGPNNNKPCNITFREAMVTAKGFEIGFFANDNFSIFGSVVDVVSGDCPIYAGGNDPAIFMSIIDSNINAEALWEDCGAICSWGSLVISLSEVKATAPGNGIYSYNNVRIDGSEVNVISTMSDAFTSSHKITIFDSEVTAKGEYAGIYTGDILEIQDGTLIAEGNDFAVLARRVLGGDEYTIPTDSPVAISIGNNCEELNGYIVKTEDWEYGEVWDSWDFRYVDRWQSYSYFVDDNDNNVSKITVSFPNTVDKAIVNGVDLVTDEDHAIECGDGTATYNPDTKVVTLTNATITGSSSDGFGIDLDGEVNTIVLVGDNAITAPNGINENASAELIIKSLDDDTDGSLEIVVTDTDYPYAVCSKKSVTVEGVTLDIKQEDSDEPVGIAIETGYVDVPCDITFKGATVKVEGFESGFFANDNFKIKDSFVSVITETYPVYAGGVDPTIEMSIEGSNVYAETLGDNADAISSWGELNIKDSEISTYSSGSGIFSYGKTYITGSIVDLHSTSYDAFYATKGITIEDSEVTAKGYVAGIATGAELEFISGKITAEGDRLAIIAQKTVDGDEDTVPVASPIAMFIDEAYEEENGYIMKTDDWMYVPFWDYWNSEYYDTWLSSSYFVDDNGNFVTKAVISLKKADYTAVDEAIEKANMLDPDSYVNFDAVINAIQAVVFDLPVAEQDSVDAMAKAIEDAIDALEAKSYGGGGGGLGIKNPNNPVDTDKAADGTGTWLTYKNGDVKFRLSQGSYAVGWRKIDGNWYYFRTEGIMAKSWIKLTNTWYYLDKDNGVMQTGWLKDNGKWYYLHDWGGMSNYEWVLDNGIWYYTRGNGELFTGWFEYKGNWYYLKSSGAMAVNETIDGYYVNANGVWVG